jgi:hypothetical protein
VDESSSFHFTYCKPRGDLAQGDLITKTDEIKELLRRVHPHYLKDDYTHLLVLTQSCDLVRRNGDPCKSRYISLAAVRPLSLVVQREVGNYQDEFAVAAGVCSKRVQKLLEQFVEKLLNNNADEYFYLERDRALGLHEPSCVFLRPSVAVRAEEHYDKLINARLLSLTDVFQAKLGWLLGKMYSRVGTPDWVPDNANETDFQRTVQEILGSVVRWVDDDQLKLAKRTRPDGVSDSAALFQHIVDTKITKKKERVIDAVLAIVEGEKLLNEQDAKKLRRLLNNDTGLATLLK